MIDGKIGKMVPGKTVGFEYANHDDDNGTGYCRGCGTTVGEPHHAICDLHGDPKCNHQPEDKVMWVYIHSEKGLWTVGFYDPQGIWNPDKDFQSPDEAAERVRWLNGGQDNE